MCTCACVWLTLWHVCLQPCHLPASSLHVCTSCLTLVTVCCTNCIDRPLPDLYYSTLCTVSVLWQAAADACIDACWFVHACWSPHQHCELFTQNTVANLAVTSIQLGLLPDYAFCSVWTQCTAICSVNPGKVESVKIFLGRFWFSFRTFCPGRESVKSAALYAYWLGSLQTGRSQSELNRQSAGQKTHSITRSESCK